MHWCQFYEWPFGLITFLPGQSSPTWWMKALWLSEMKCVGWQMVFCRLMVNRKGSQTKNAITNEAFYRKFTRATPGYPASLVIHIIWMTYNEISPFTFDDSSRITWYATVGCTAKQFYTHLPLCFWELHNHTSKNQKAVYPKTLIL